MTSLLLLIVFARLMGRLMARFGQPQLVGEILAGVILGPAVFDFIQAGPALAGIAELAVFLVVLAAGLEMNYRDIASLFKQKLGLGIALLSFALPFVAGCGLGAAFGFDVMRNVFLGLCISITALPVAIRILEGFNLLNSQIAKYAIAAAIINDIIALMILGVILDLPSVLSVGSVAISIVVTGGKLILLGAVVVGFNRLFEFIEKKGLHIQMFPEKLVKLFGDEALLGIVIVFVLAFGSISDALGFHFIIGAFFGALLIDKKYFLAMRYRQLERSLASITHGFLAPVFFAYLGLEFKIMEMHSPQFVVAVLFVSIFSKLLAGWLGGLIGKLPRRESLGLGIIMNGRGVMELVVAGIAFQRGFIGSGLFSTMVLMGVVTTLLTPILFRKWALPYIKTSET